MWLFKKSTNKTKKLKIKKNSNGDELLNNRRITEDIKKMAMKPVTFKGYGKEQFGW